MIETEIFRDAIKIMANDISRALILAIADHPGQSSQYLGSIIGRKPAYCSMALQDLRAAGIAGREVLERKGYNTAWTLTRLGQAIARSLRRIKKESDRRAPEGVRPSRLRSAPLVGQCDPS